MTKNNLDITVTMERSGRTYELMMKKDTEDNQYGIWVRDVTGDDATDDINVGLDDGSQWFDDLHDGIHQTMEVIDRCAQEHFSSLTH